MDKKKWIIAGGVVSVIILGAIAFGFVKEFVIKKDPINHLFYSMMKTDYSAIEGHYDSQIRVNPEVLSDNLLLFASNPDAMAEFITAVLDELHISGKMVNIFDFEKNDWHYQQSMSINYAEGVLLALDMVADERGLVVNSPMISDKSMVLSKDAFFNLMKNETGKDFSQVDFNKYFKTLNFEKDPLFKTFLKDYKGYEEILRERLSMLEKGPALTVTLSDGETVNCDTLILEMRYAEIIDLYNALLTEAKYDLELKAFVKGKILENMTLFLNSEDYKLLDLEEAEVVSTIESIEADFDETWEMAIQEMLEVYSQVQDMEMQYRMTFAIDSKYRLRQIQTASEIMGIVAEQTMTYDNFRAKSSENGALNDISAHYDIAKMIEDEIYAQETASELISGGLDHILGSEAVTNMMNDISQKSDLLPPNEAQTVKDGIKYFFDNRDAWKDSLMEGLEL